MKVYIILPMFASAILTALYGIDDYAKRAGKMYFGTAANLPTGGAINDKYYMAHFNNTQNFGQTTATNVMKWIYAEPERGVFDFSLGDDFVRLAEANEYILRCHNLIWHEQYPGWIDTTDWTKNALLEVVRRRVKETITHYGDICYCWDVVNEAINDDGTYRQSIFYNVTGPEYITVAYKTAQRTIAELGLNVKLYYNDYNIEYPGTKATAVQEMIVKSLKKSNIQLDGVGLESHFIIGETPSMASQMQNMADFASLGVETAITELDVRALSLPLTQAQKTQQIIDYNNTISACAMSKSCIGTTLWDFDDTYSWIPSTYVGEGYATPWYQPGGANTPLKKKRGIYAALVNAFNRQIGTGK
ncbi:hypothetical protein ANO11243_075830 [Dothideomycetidae sp. 11243]|nr:hypothetical protein ANO11243_075830 [fungal sp. No.11243]